MQIDDDDYMPIDAFVLRWRWDEKHCPTMTAEELARIHPLKAAKAKEIYTALGDFDASDIGLSKYSGSTHVVQFSTEGEPATVVGGDASAF